MAIAYANIAEVFIHKFLLHTLGKNKGSYWSFHFHDHHKRVTKSRGLDTTYENGDFYGKEIFVGMVLILSHAPLFYVSPIFVLALYVYMLLYYWAHTKSHMSVEWAKRWLPWHYDHHLGSEEANWGVLLPFADWIFGTRVRYYRTAKYYRDELKKRN